MTCRARSAMRDRRMSRFDSAASAIPASTRASSRELSSWSIATRLYVLKPRNDLFPGRADGSMRRLLLVKLTEQGAALDEKIRIMLVDDHEVGRKGLAALIEAEEDLEVVGEASDGAEAVRLARLFRPRVVVMDVRMPGGGGVAACRDLRDQNPGADVIMLTSYSD